MSYKRLGDYIQLVDKRNKDLAVTNLLGINIFKNYMPSVANQTGLDLTKYKVVSKGQFATNLMHVNRDEVLPVALYTDEQPALVSPAYKTFEVIDENELLPEFLMMEFQRPEFDRKAWTYCDSSVRGGLEWERLCDMGIPDIDIEEQRKYVALYKGLLNNQKVYENSLDDLQLICDTYMETLKNIENKQPLGELIKTFDIRNSDGKIKNLLGINVKKEFMPSKAKVSDISLLNYKVIEEGVFSTNIMHVGRDELLPVALYQSEKKSIVSPAYKCFKIKNSANVISEFLMLWFYRAEFDRMTWYYCDSSVRGGLEWSRFLDIKIPIPDIKIQQAIVTIYHTLETRKRINEQLKNSIKPLCPILMRGVVEKMEKAEVVI